MATVPSAGCYAALTETGRHRVTSGPVQRLLRVAGIRCGGAAPAIPRHGLLLASGAAGRGAAFVRGLERGQQVLMNQLIGFGGSTSLLGGSEPLVAGGQVLAQLVDRPGAYAQGPQPRTAAGVTADGRLLVVVVDGRRPGWSQGMTLRQLATLMRGLGAVSAINLDGGGSSTVVLSGLVVNRPSDDAERAVSSALAVLPPGARPVGPSSSRAALRGEVPPTGAGAADGWISAARDAGSTGGLAETVALSGNPLEGALELALSLFRPGH